MSFRRLFIVSVLAASCVVPRARAQRHGVGSSPPTAPPPPAAAPQPAAIEPVSSGLGALQFVEVDYSVPAPQSLLHQLQSEDDRARAIALAALGAPAQYLTRGHIPYPRSVQLDFVPLGVSDDLDAILTVELDQHLVSAIMVPDDGNWKRVADVLFPTPFSDFTTNPGTFLRTARAPMQHNRYLAIFHGSVTSSSGDFTENEALLRVMNGRAVITISFVSGARTCAAPSATERAHSSCDLVDRWLQPDTADPLHHFLMVTGSGHIYPHDTTEPIGSSRIFQLSHLRFFSCQSFDFSESTSHFEPTAQVVPCGAHDAPAPPASPARP